METVEKFSKQNAQDVLLVINYSSSNSRKKYVKALMTEFINSPISIYQLNSFDKSITLDENYKLYMIKYRAS
ncbi:hypothetical protein PCC6912_45630 [Chlorogloeopsis fritschii PCC 6912]|uniref:Uncharacterized protein n=1 Tax=Chlorogloeopsis fritschii PCC 6912 TaxID=211165 RepID=A0A3S0ZZD6_CHLFR|nr:hypothetical protein PCC6912_45630 [Chlorogloeopsis fritschii PCC 6912]